MSSASSSFIFSSSTHSWLLINNKMSKDRQERDAEKQNGMDNPRQQEICPEQSRAADLKMIMDPRQPLAFQRLQMLL